MRKGIVLFDNDEEFVWRDDRDGELHTFQYGTFLIKMAYIGAGNLREVYRDIIGRKLFEKIGDKADLSTASDAYIKLDTELDKMLKEIHFGDEISVEDGFSFNIPQDVSEMIYIEERHFFESVMWIELAQIMNGDIAVDEPVEKLIPQFLSDKMLESDIEKILLGEDISVERMNEFLMMDMLCYVPQYLDGDLCKAYMISSLSQLLVLEIMKVQENKNGKYKYTKCPICGRIFAQKVGTGNIRKYCEYPYSKGLCKIEGQKRIDAGRSDIEIHYKKMQDRIRKFEERHAAKHDKIYKWKDEFEDFHQDLIEQNVSSDEYISKTNTWYDNKKKTVIPKTRKKR